MYGEDVCRIQKLQNGYVVTMNDPVVLANNRKRSSVKYDSAEYKALAPYKDPEVKYTFKDTSAVTAFLTKNLDKMKSDGDGDSFDCAFDDAVAEANGDDD